MIKFVRLILLRPNERFFAQCISISIEPSAFVRERIRLGDTTNFARAAGFFVSAISTAFLAEVATLHLLGIGGLAEPYYWLVILLTSIPFVLLCFLLLWLVARLSFKNVLHLSFYPVGAGVFAGAAFALVVSAVVALSVAVGFADNIKHDFEGWETGVALYEEVLRECQKEESLTYTIVAAGFGEAYESLKPPIDSISYLRPVITILYLIVAASFFMAAVDRRKWVVFSLVLFAAVIATGANFTLFKTYLDWNLDRSGCTEEKLGELARARMGESLLRRPSFPLPGLAVRFSPE